MKLLLTNDDGIDAPGIAALWEAAAGLGDRLMLAPSQCYSGCSHQVTTEGPIRIQAESTDRIRVYGTPADCVRLGLHQWRPDATWILSGINCGGNLGADIHLSGTVAAVREAVLHGRPGIAVSQYRRRGQDIDWRRSARWVAPLLAEILAQPAEPGVFWNINLPHLDSADADPPAVRCPVDPSPLALSFKQEGESWHYNGDYHNRPRKPGTDVDVCFNGRIAVSRVVLWE